MKSKKSKKSNYSNLSNKSNNKSDREGSQKIQSKETKKGSYYSITFITNITKPKTIADKIKIFLYTNPKQTIKQVSEKIGIDYNKLKTIMIQQNKSLFKSVGKIGRELIYSLSKEAKEQIDFLIKQYNKKLEKQKQEEFKAQELTKTKEELLFEIKQFFNDKNNYERINNILYIDLKKLKQFLIISIMFEDNPEETLQLFKSVLDDKKLELILSFKNISQFEKRNIESLRAEHLNKLILLEAKSTSLSDIRPQVVNAKFECPSCGTIISILQIDKKFREPTKCTCGRRGQFRLFHRSMVDVARVILEDLKTDLSTKNIKGIIKGELTSQSEIKKFNPGNDILVLGILKEAPLTTLKGSLSTLLDYCFEILAVEPFEPEININEFNEEDKKRIKNLSRKYEEKGFEAIRDSIAPEIFGNEKIKDSIIIQASQPKNNPNKKIRDKSNILLIGDPGTSKSIILNFVKEITQGAMACSGSGSTEVGLTATVEKSDEGWNLKPGVLVLANDLAIIDEMNLIEEEDRKKLQEGMNEMKISINKASIHTSLKVTCGILASANPIFGKFEDSNLIKQFNLYPPIMNRFDFIWTIRDKIDKENDFNIASRMMERENKKINSDYDIPFLKKFFLYIKNQPEPKFKENLNKLIPKIYVKSRKEKINDTNSLLNPRFNETIIRCSKASARLRLSKFVEEKDVKRVLEVISKTYFDIEDIDFWGKSKDMCEK